MPDFCDRAAAEYEEHFRRAMAARISRLAEQARESEIYCVDCNCEIPEKRRIAIKGCERCVKCQEAHDA